MSKKLVGNYRLGQSVIEVIVAVSIFVIIAGSSVVTVLGSFLTTRLAEEETKATLLGEEGLEAIDSIRNQDWSSLVDGTYGLSESGGSWSFSGTSDFDPSGKFERMVTVASVQRDANGNIVGSGGSIDEDTKFITSSVSWNFTAVRLLNVELNSYLTNWGESIGGIPSGSPTPTPSPTPIPTPTATPAPNTCESFCQSSGYSSGICRRNAAACSQNGETYQGGGDQFCTGGPSFDTCCCI